MGKLTSVVNHFISNVHINLDQTSHFQHACMSCRQAYLMLIKLKLGWLVKQGTVVTNLLPSILSKRGSKRSIIEFQHHRVVSQHMVHLLYFRPIWQYLFYGVNLVLKWCETL